MVAVGKCSICGGNAVLKDWAGVGLVPCKHCDHGSVVRETLHCKECNQVLNNWDLEVSQTHCTRHQKGSGL